MQFWKARMSTKSFAVFGKFAILDIFFLSKHWLQCTNNLQLAKINQNNMIKMSQTTNITLQPMQ